MAEGSRKIKGDIEQIEQIFGHKKKSVQEFYV